MEKEAHIRLGNRNTLMGAHISGDLVSARSGRIKWQVGLVMFITLFVMSAYQFAKYNINPDIILFASNLVTVLFSTLVAGSEGMGFGYPGFTCENSG